MLVYDDLENTKTDRVNAIVFNLHQIKRLKFLLGHPVLLKNILVTPNKVLDITNNQMLITSVRIAHGRNSMVVLLK